MIPSRAPVSDLLQEAGFVPHPVWTESWILPGAGETIRIPAGLAIRPAEVHHATLRAFVKARLREGGGLRYSTIFAGYATVQGTRVPLLVHVVLASDVPALLERAASLVKMREVRAARRAAAAAAAQAGEVAP